jgi:hypothetical protein
MKYLVTECSAAPPPQSPEEGNTSSFQNVFSSYLEFRTMSKAQVHKSGDSECYTP